MSLAVGAADPAIRQCTITTTRCDSTRAQLQVCGFVDAAGAAVLEAVLEGHLRTGRRYLRVDVGGTSTLDEAALRVLVNVHRRLLGAHGTLIITAVTPQLAQVPRAADPAF